MKNFTKLIATLLAIVMILSVLNPVSTRALDWEDDSGTNTGDIETNKGTIDVNDGSVHSNGEDGGLYGTVSTNNGRIEWNLGTVTNNYGNEFEPNDLYFGGSLIKGIGRNSGLVCTNHGRITSNGYDAMPADTSAECQTWTKGVQINETDGTILINYGAVGINEGTINTNEDYVSSNNGTIGINRSFGTIINGGGGTVTNNFGTVTFVGANAIVANQYDGTVAGESMSDTITNYFGGVVTGSGITVTNNFADIDDDTPTVLRNAANQYRAVSFVVPEHSNVTYGNGFTEKALIDQYRDVTETLYYIKQGDDNGVAITITPEDGWGVFCEEYEGHIETEDYAFDYSIDYTENLYEIIIIISGYSGNSSNLSLAGFGLAEYELAEVEDIHIFRWEQNANGDYEPVEWTSDDDFEIELSNGDEYDLYLSFAVRDDFISGDGVYPCNDNLGFPVTPFPSPDYSAPSPIASLSEDQAETSRFVHYIFTSAHITNEEWTVGFSADLVEATRAFTVKAKTAPEPEQPQPSYNNEPSYDPNAPVVTRVTKTNSDGSDSMITKTVYPDGRVREEISTVYPDGLQKLDIKETKADGSYIQSITETDKDGKEKTTVIKFTVGNGYTEKETNITYPDGTHEWSNERRVGNGDYNNQSRTYTAENALVERHDSKQVTKADGSIAVKEYDKDAEGKSSYTAVTAADGSMDATRAVVDFTANTREETVTAKASDGSEKTTYSCEPWKSEDADLPEITGMTVETDKSGASTLTALTWTAKAEDSDKAANTDSEPNADDLEDVDGRDNIGSTSVISNSLIIPEDITTADGRAVSISTVGSNALTVEADEPIKKVVLSQSISKLDKSAFEGVAMEELEVKGKVKFEKNALKGTKLKKITATKKMTFTKNSLKGTSKKMVIIVKTKKQKKQVEKQLKKAGAPNAVVKVIGE